MESNSIRDLFYYNALWSRSKAVKSVIPIYSWLIEI